MLNRRLYNKISSALTRQACVAIIGARQVGKTTLALEIGKERNSIYLDLESQTDRSKLKDPSLFLEHYEDNLVILDEIHRMPELFQELRGIIDKGRRKNKGIGRFLILGSAAIDLLRQSGETLAGRITYINMTPLNILEIAPLSPKKIQLLWLRGGFPDSYLAKNNKDSLEIRKSFIKTYLERDIPQFGVRIAAETLERFWVMLAHLQGSMLNASKLAANLAVTSPTITSYVDLLVDLLLVRRLTPYHINTKKRLVKAPKIYIRDSGLLHALLNIENYEDILKNPIIGASWEGFVIENILNIAPDGTMKNFYRTSAGAEIDLLLEFPGGELWAIEIKSGLRTTPSKGFYNAIEDVKPKRSFVVYAGEDNYPISENIEAISLAGIIELITHRK